ncbi:MAG: putative Ig domain-containing protein [Gammaproteobacteria bacterium]|nr:putative Ig domain-containing protein [Gammaproteobacteria bacterium]
MNRFLALLAFINVAYASDLRVEYFKHLDLNQVKSYTHNETFELYDYGTKKYILINDDASGDMLFLLGDQQTPTLIGDIVPGLGKGGTVLTSISYKNGILFEPLDRNIPWMEFSLGNNQIVISELVNDIADFRNNSNTGTNRPVINDILTLPNNKLLILESNQVLIYDELTKEITSTDFYDIDFAYEIGSSIYLIRENFDTTEILKTDIENNSILTRHLVPERAYVYKNTSSESSQKFNAKNTLFFQTISSSSDLITHYINPTTAEAELLLTTVINNNSYIPDLNNIFVTSQKVFFSEFHINNITVRFSILNRQSGELFSNAVVGDDREFLFAYHYMDILYASDEVLLIGANISSISSDKTLFALRPASNVAEILKTEANSNLIQGSLFLLDSSVEKVALAGDYLMFVDKTSLAVDAYSRTPEMIFRESFFHRDRLFFDIKKGESHFDNKLVVFDPSLKTVQQVLNIETGLYANYGVSDVLAFDDLFLFNKYEGFPAQNKQWFRTDERLNIHNISMSTEGRNYFASDIDNGVYYISGDSEATAVDYYSLNQDLESEFLSTTNTELTYIRDIVLETSEILVIYADSEDSAAEYHLVNKETKSLHPLNLGEMKACGTGLVGQSGDHFVYIDSDNTVNEVSERRAHIGEIMIVADTKAIFSKDSEQDFKQDYYIFNCNSFELELLFTDLNGISAIQYANDNEEVIFEYEDSTESKLIYFHLPTGESNEITGFLVEQDSQLTRRYITNQFGTFIFDALYHDETGPKTRVYSLTNGQLEYLTEYSGRFLPNHYSKQDPNGNIYEAQSVHGQEINIVYYNPTSNSFYEIDTHPGKQQNPYVSSYYINDEYLIAVHPNMHLGAEAFAIKLDCLGDNKTVSIHCDVPLENFSPELTLNEKYEVVPEMYLSIQPQLYDLDYQEWSFSSDFLPSWLNIDTSTGTLTGVVPSDFTGELEFDLTVFDGIEMTSASSIITNNPDIALTHQTPLFVSQDNGSDDDGSDGGGSDDDGSGGDSDNDNNGPSTSNGSGGTVNSFWLFLLIVIVFRKNGIFLLRKLGSFDQLRSTT